MNKLKEDTGKTFSALFRCERTGANRTCQQCYDNVICEEFGRIFDVFQKQLEDVRMTALDRLGKINVLNKQLDSYKAKLKGLREVYEEHKDVGDIWILDKTSLLGDLWNAIKQTVEE